MDDMIRNLDLRQNRGLHRRADPGRGWIHHAAQEYFEIVAGIVKKAGGLFISDEVQTGWAAPVENGSASSTGASRPISSPARRASANGAPVGLTVARPEVADALKGTTISTFGGNPVTANRRESRHRLHRRAQADDQRRRDRRVSARQARRDESEVTDHRRRARQWA